MKTNSKKGSALLASIILVFLVGVVLGSFLHLSNQTALQAEKNFIFNGLYNVAETGTPKEIGPVIESWEEIFGVNFEEI